MNNTALLVECLLDFAGRHGLVSSLDVYVSRNTLLDLFGLAEPWEGPVPAQTEPAPTAILDGLLDADPTNDVVMALNDPTALGAMAALEERHLMERTLVYGVDGAPEAKNMIFEGVMTATVAQSPIQIGQTTAQVIYQILSGQAYESEIIVPVELITEENVEQFGSDGWQ